MGLQSTARGPNPARQDRPIQSGPRCSSRKFKHGTNN